jgi:hypothetical protein
LKQWVAQVELLRDFSVRLLEGDVDRETVKSRVLEAGRVFRDLVGRVDLYQAVGHEKSLKGVRLSSGEYSLLNGVEYNPPKTIWSVERQSKATAFSNWPRQFVTADTREEAIANFKAAYDSIDTQPDAKNQVSFSLYGRRGQNGTIIGKKVGRDYIDLKRFDDIKSARRYLAENHDEIVRLLNRHKEIPNERKESNSPRVGVDHRDGADVTPEQFAEAFGFRGVQFGNYVELARRQGDLNNAYDALMDLAGVLNIPPRALSLNGALGLAFGARGRGKQGKITPAAHYEPGHVVINLTKTKGAGSLAHEWWHALDNYFSRARSDPEGYVSERPYERGDGVRPEMVAAFREIAQTIQKSGIPERSKKLDRSRSNPYWGQGREMTARAFESYIIAKLHDQGAANDYLANIVDQETWDAATALGLEKDDSYPYVTAAETPAIRDAYDEFFRVIESRETEGGNIALFRVPDSDRSDNLTPDGEKAAQAALDVLRRIAPDAPVTLYEDITDADGNVIAFGAYMDGVISLALNSPDITGTARHEAIHFLRAVGAIKPGQWEALRRAAVSEGWVEKHNIAERYPNLSEDRQIEEAVAEEFASRGATNGKGQVDRVFAYMRRIFDQIARAMRKVLGRDPTAADLFADIESGKVGQQGQQLTVDGDRMLQAAPQTETAAFKRWFGDSKVVDENGEPLRVFHGSRSQEIESFDTVDGAYFTPDEEDAASYPDMAGYDPEGRVYGVYLSIQDPLEVSAPEFGTDTPVSFMAESRRRELEQQGYDGAIARRPDGSIAEIVAFRPEQIKSATGNRGTFDLNDPRIAFQTPDPYRPKRQPEMAEIAVGIQPSPWYERVQEYMQDKMVRWKTVQKAVEDVRGSKLDESENVYLQEELYIGRAGERLDELTNVHLKPIAEAIADSGLKGATVSIPDGNGDMMDVTGGQILEAYLYAKHAPERNAQIAKINPDFEEGTGSGMTDADAAATLDAIEKAGFTNEAASIASMVRDMLNESIDTRVEGGLMSQEQAAKWRDTYKHYVPLRGIQNEENDTVLPRQGKGYNVRGPESKRALGRQSRATDILGNTFVMAQESIVRAEKNRVFQALLNLVTKNPDPDLWEVNRVRMAYTLNKSTGQAEYRPVNALTLDEADKTLRGKVNGTEVRILIHDPYLARSLQSMGAENFGIVTRFLMPISRMLSSLNTSYNPEFVITNAFRDIQTAGVNLQQYDLDGITKDVLKNWRRGLAAALDAQDMKALGGAAGVGLSSDARQEWEALFKRYGMAGGRVSFWKIGELSDHMADINRIMADADPSSARRLLNAGKATIDFIEKANVAVDNAVRLAAFKAAVDRGMSDAQAASLAKNLTVNFNRKGWAGPAMNAMFMFYNAGIQGTAIMFSAMKSKRVRKVMGGIVVAGMMAEMLNAALSPEDEDGDLLYDKIGGSRESADFLKSRNLIIMDPFDLAEDGYWSIPLAYGYNVFWDLGRNLAAYMRGGQTGGRAMANMLSTTVDMFNPIGLGQNLLTTITPTVIKPGVEIAMNENFMDGPIYPEPSQFDTAPKPYSAQPWRNTSTISTEVAQWLNDLTGGDRVRPGEIDIPPQAIDHVASFFTGAAGRFWGNILNDGVNRATAAWKGEAQPDVELRDVPFARKIYRVKPSYRDRSEAYDAIRDVYGASLTLKRYREADAPDKAKAFHDERKATINLKPYAKKVRKDLKMVRAQRDALELQGVSRTDPRFERIDKQEAKIVEGFLKAYKAAQDRENDAGGLLSSTTKRKQAVLEPLRAIAN